MEHENLAVRCEITGHVATIVLDRPRVHNAITPAMAARLFDLMRTINDDSNVRAVVLTGAGPKSFCVGSDIGSLGTYGSTWAFRHRLDYSEAVWQIRKPTIAAVNGYALGGGLELALACDIRLACREASFGGSEIKLGWHAGNSTQWLPRLVGTGRAMRLLLSGDAIGAQAALEAGLVEELFDKDALVPEAIALASRIAENAPLAAEVTKRLVRLAQSAPLDVGMQAQADLQAYCFTTEDAAEGIAAFGDRRKAHFCGR